MNRMPQSRVKSKAVREANAYRDEYTGIAMVLPADARQMLIEASNEGSKNRRIAIDQAIDTIRTKYPKLFTWAEPSQFKMFTS